jgi:hypothetical protein
LEATDLPAGTASVEITTIDQARGLLRITAPCRYDTRRITTSGDMRPPDARVAERRRRRTRPRLLAGIRYGDGTYARHHAQALRHVPARTRKPLDVRSSQLLYIIHVIERWIRAVRYARWVRLFFSWLATAQTNARWAPSRSPIFRA